MNLNNIDDITDIEQDDEYMSDALTAATEALDSAVQLDDMLQQAATPHELTSLYVAAESAASRFGMSSVGIEEIAATASSNDIKQRSRIRKIIDYLTAVAKRVIAWFLSWFRTQYILMPKFADMARDFVNRAEAVAGRKPEGVISERGLVNGLAIDGISPKRLSLLLDASIGSFERNFEAACIGELSEVLKVAKGKDLDATRKASEKLHAKLLAAAKSTLKNVTGKEHPAFKVTTPGNLNFSSDASFGQNYLTVSISAELTDFGTFDYSAPLVRDIDVVPRTSSFDPVHPNEIRTICKSVILLTEKILEHSKIEDASQKLLRDGEYLAKKAGTDVATIPALRNFAAVVNNQYFAYLRFSVRNMKLIMRYCRLSLEAYERGGEK